MKDQLVPAYEAHLLSLFQDTRDSFKEKAFGATKQIIYLTIPFMVLETWRENGHSSYIPLLDDAVKNIVFATASLMFGWTKTCCLHLRVALENVFMGATILNDEKLLSHFKATGVVKYKRFKEMVNNFENTKGDICQVSRSFNLKSLSLELYEDLSNWSHTLGTEFVCDLSILGYSKLSRSNIGKIKLYFGNLSKISSIVYLSVNPTMFQDLSRSRQTLFLSRLDKMERKNLRELLKI